MRAAQMGVLKDAGYEVPDVSYSVLTYDDGAVVSLAVSYALPEKYPALGHAARVEVLGTDGVIILDDDHTSKSILHARRRRRARSESHRQDDRQPRRRAQPKVVAEDIETKEQMDLVTQLGCHEGQGYYFSRPINSDAIRTYLQTSQTKKRRVG
jgi:predicted dehydrogenase